MIPKSKANSVTNIITPQPVHSKLISHATHNSMSGKLSNDLNLSQSNQSCEDLRREKSLQNNTMQGSNCKRSLDAFSSNSKQQVDKELSRQNEKLMHEVSYLYNKNGKLEQEMFNMDQEIAYLKLREKKIMYLVHLMQGRGYPVTQVFEKHVKPINTLRFEEFLLQQEKEAAKEEELEKEAANQFSFNVSDSYELLVDGPALKPQKPGVIPDLCLNGLPEYVTSSEEDDESGTHDIQQSHQAQQDASY